MLLVHYCSGLQDCAEQVNKDQPDDGSPSSSHESTPERGIAATGDATCDAASNATSVQSTVETGRLHRSRSFSEPSDWQNISDAEC